MDEAMLRGLVKIEDGWYGKTSFTGATGIGQFTVGTWNWLANTIEGAKIGMSPITSANKNTRLDPRYNQKINMLATALYARWHKEQFIRRGIQINDENLYMAHNIGLLGLSRAISRKSTAEDLKNMRRNGMKKWMSVSDFIAYQKNRYTQNKLAANFMSEPTQRERSFKWVMPKKNNNDFIWIEPEQQQILALPKII
ncbi:hypothetical protein [[Haemophilus] ducreyi]|uniref:hypothetical protein n=1 Tax=Haemophilus ducreyi TaxID=730 RepID=UPI001E3BF1BC|nr:hypothetical protein [[Haemophilus] ducreyi]